MTSTQINVRIDDETLGLLDELCERRGRSRQHLILHVLDKLLAGEGLLDPELIAARRLARGDVPRDIPEPARPDVPADTIADRVAAVVDRSDGEVELGDDSFLDAHDLSHLDAVSKARAKEGETVPTRADVVRYAMGRLIGFTPTETVALASRLESVGLASRLKRDG